MDKNKKLPVNVVCPYCKAELELEKEEQESGKFTCPDCKKVVTKEKVHFVQPMDKMGEQKGELLAVQTREDQGSTRLNAFSTRKLLRVVVVLVVMVLYVALFTKIYSESRLKSPELSIIALGYEPIHYVEDPTKYLKAYVVIKEYVDGYADVTAEVKRLEDAIIEIKIRGILYGVGSFGIIFTLFSYLNKKAKIGE